MDASSYVDEDGLDIELFCTNPRDDQTNSLVTRASMINLESLVVQYKDEGRLNVSLHKGMTLLHFAVFLNRLDLVDMLANHGMDVNVLDEVGYSPVHTACIFGRPECLSVLIQSGGLVNNLCTGKASDVTLAEEPIRLAIKNHNRDCVRILLENGAHPDNLYFRGHELNIIDLDELEIMELLLKFGANTESLDRFGRTPLMRACKLNKINAVNLLLRYGANPNARVEQGDRKSVFYWALKSEEMTLAILQNGGDWTQPFNHHGRYNNTVVIIVSKGYVSCLRELLTREEFRISDLYQYRTPLGWLCMQDSWTDNHYTTLDVLLNSGADPNFGCVRLESPLLCHLRVMKDKSHIQVVLTLLNYGAKVLMISPEKTMFNILSLDFSTWPRIPLNLLRLLLNAASEIDPLIFIDRLIPYIEFTQRHHVLNFLMTPRSLKHLCRSVLRETFMPRRTFHQDLDELGPLPPNLIDYLLLKS